MGWSERISSFLGLESRVPPDKLARVAGKVVSATASGCYSEHDRSIEEETRLVCCRNGNDRFTVWLVMDDANHKPKRGIIDRLNLNLDTISDIVQFDFLEGGGAGKFQANHIRGGLSELSSRQAESLLDSFLHSEREDVMTPLIVTQLLRASKDRLQNERVEIGWVSSPVKTGS